MIPLAPTFLACINAAAIFPTLLWIGEAPESVHAARAALASEKGYLTMGSDESPVAFGRLVKVSEQLRRFITGYLRLLRSTMICI